MGETASMKVSTSLRKRTTTDHSLWGADGAYLSPVPLPLSSVHPTVKGVLYLLLSDCWNKHIILLLSQCPVWTLLRTWTLLGWEGMQQVTSLLIHNNEKIISAWKSERPVGRGKNMKNNWIKCVYKAYTILKIYFLSVSDLPLWMCTRVHACCPWMPKNRMDTLKVELEKVE